MCRYEHLIISECVEIMCRCGEGVSTKGGRRRDRGKKFASHEQVCAATGAEFCFATPHCPWRRGSDENTNDLLRECFPKGEPLDGVEEEEMRDIYDKINMRPRKRPGYRMPYEVNHGTALHVI